MEAELEAQLKQTEQQVRDLRSANHRLQFEHNSIKVRAPVCVLSANSHGSAFQEKYESLNRDHHTRVNELEAQVRELRAKNDEACKRIRQLEQTNDDLERANRYVLFHYFF